MESRWTRGRVEKRSRGNSRQAVGRGVYSRILSLPLVGGGERLNEGFGDGEGNERGEKRRFNKNINFGSTK